MVSNEAPGGAPPPHRGFEVERDGRFGAPGANRSGGLAQRLPVHPGAFFQFPNLARVLAKPQTLHEARDGFQAHALCELAQLPEDPVGEVRLFESERLRPRSFQLLCYPLNRGGVLGAAKIGRHLLRRL